MLSKEEKAFYLDNGYFLLKRFFDKEEIRQVLLDAKKVFLLQFREKKYTSVIEPDQLSEKEFNEMLYRLFKEDMSTLANCGKQVQHLISLHRLSLHQKITDLLTSTGLQFPNISTRPVLYFNHPKLSKEKVFHKVDAHQDWRSMQGSLNSVVIWVPLVDVNRDLGALEIIPKSHKLGLITDNVHYGFGMVNLSSDQREEIISVEVEQGDVLLFSSFLIHQSGDNVTDMPRWSCHFRYNDLSERTFIQRGFAHPYLYKPMEDLITPGFPEIKQLLNIFSNDRS